MKILILINNDYCELNNVDGCKNRNDFFVFMLKTHFMALENVEIIIQKCYPYINMNLISNNNLTLNNFPLVDQIIFVDEIGFYKKDKFFIEYLKKYSNNFVCSISISPKFYFGEDIMFGFMEDSINNNYHFVKPPCEKLIYLPIKEENNIYILMSKSQNIYKKNNSMEINFILESIKKNFKKDTLFVLHVGLINTTSVDFINMENEIINTKIFHSYIEYINEIAKSNIYILTDNCDDVYRLYELSMCNTLILANIKFITNKIQTELKILTYDLNIEWSEIFEKIIDIDTRSFLINNYYSWENFIQIIMYKFQIINMNNIDMNNVNIINNFNINNNDNKLSSMNNILNIDNKTKPHIIDNDKKKINNTKINRISKGVFLQSQLLS